MTHPDSCVTVRDDSHTRLAATLHPQTAAPSRKAKVNTENQSEHNETNLTQDRTPIFKNRLHRIGFLSLYAILAVLFTQLITSFTFSCTFTHYPTLPFAAFCGATFTLFCIVILWRQPFAGRFITPVLAFFLTVIYTQVNSELSALPTDDQKIINAYKIFIASMVAMATLCIASQVIAPNTSAAHTDKDRQTADNTVTG